MPEEPRVCVDANILVDVFSAHPQHADDVENSRWVLQAAERGEHRLVIPAHVISEVFGANVMRARSGAERKRVREAVARVTTWLHNSRFLVVEIDQRLAVLGGELAQALDIKGADALVLAAAQRARCSIVYTRDGKMIARSGQPELMGLTVKSPNRLEVPEQQVMELPDLNGDPN